MAFNYNVSGLTADIAGAIVNKKKLALADREMKIAEQNLKNKMDDRQLRDLYMSIFETKQLYDNGMEDEALQGLQERNEILQEYGADNSDTQALLGAYASGDKEKFETALDAGLQMGYQSGYLKPPEPEDLEYDTSNTFYDGEGKEYFNVINKTAQTLSKQYTGGSLEDELENIRKRADAKGVDLSKEASVFILEKRRGMDNNLNMANKAKKLQDELSRIAKKGDLTDQGVLASLQDSARQFLGEEDVDTFTRRAIGGYFNQRVVADRPPGAMSNFEFKTIRAGYPSGNANPELLAQYFKEAAQASRLSSELDRISGTLTEQTGGLFTAKKGTSIDGMKVKQGETITEFQNRWLDRENEREGERLKEQERKRRKNTKEGKNVPDTLKRPDDVPTNENSVDLDALSDDDFLELINRG